MTTLFKKTKLTKTLLFTLTLQSLMLSSVMVMAETSNSAIVSQITKMHLPASALTSAEPKSKSSSALSRQQKILAGLAIGSLPGNDGIPQGIATSPADDSYSSAYTTSTLLDEALDKAQTLGIGERITHFENMAFEIVKLSEKEKRPNEELVRITLNRAVDVVNGVLEIMGNNNEEAVAQIITNLYQEHFNLAKMFINSPSQLSFRGQAANQSYNPGFSIAEYGRIYSTLLWRFSAGLTSKTAKAIMLMKLVSYLGYDIDLDQNHNSSSLQEVIADVIRLQTRNPNYQKILTDIENNNEPMTVNILKSDVTYILHKLPARLQQAGIRSQGSAFTDGP